MNATRRALIALAVLAVLCLILLLAPQPGQSPSADGDAGTTGSGSAGGAKASLTAAFDAEFHSRPDGYKGLATHYDLAFQSEPLQMDPGLMYKAAAEGSVDVIDGFATDGRIAKYDLLVLKDDKQFFPPYYAAPLIREEALEKHPALKTILNQLAGRLDNTTMQKLNLSVDEEGRKAADVAQAFLEEHGLLAADAKAGAGTAGTIRIGGKQFTEQEILGELMALLIEHHSDLKVERKLNLGGTMICFNALKNGDLDLYAEYTGTGLVSILKEEVIADPDAAYKKVKEDFAAKYQLSWLRPFGFNNTYTLTMRRKQAESLGIKTISDLATHLGGR